MISTDAYFHVGLWEENIFHLIFTSDFIVASRLASPSALQHPPGETLGLLSFSHTARQLDYNVQDRPQRRLNAIIHHFSLELLHRQNRVLQRHVSPK